MRVFGLEVSRPKPPVARFLGDVVKVDLSPGDVCLLMARAPMAPEEAQRLTDVWRATVGDDVTLLILDEGMKIGVLSPPHAQAVHERLQDEQAVERAITE